MIGLDTIRNIPILYNPESLDELRDSVVSNIAKIDSDIPQLEKDSPKRKDYELKNWI